MRVYQFRSDKYMMIDKHYGRNVEPKNVSDILDKYYSSDLSTMKDIHKKIVEELTTLNAYFQVQTEYHFNATSVFIIYEGDPLEKNPQINVKLIDFFYTRNGEGKIDESTCYGIEQLLNLFRNYKF